MIPSRFSLLLFGSSTLCWLSLIKGQPAAPGARFDVASIKVTPSGTAARWAGAPSPDTFAVSGLQLKYLICVAYNVEGYQVLGGPSWMDSEAYDIVAKAEGGGSSSQFPVMLQNLLADRFSLRLHRETRPMRSYILALDKNGPKFRNSGGDAKYSRRISDGHLTYTRVGMKAFGQWLSNQVGRTVVDMTDLEGYYDFSLEWTPDLPAVTSETHHADALSTGAPSLFSAVREQLGLKLELRTVQLEFLVIDHAAKPSEN